MNPNRANWQELRSLLLGVFNEAEAALDAKNRELVADFIESREFEVALDWLSSLIEERRVVLSMKAQQSIVDARRLMQKAE